MVDEAIYQQALEHLERLRDSDITIEEKSEILKTLEVLAPKLAGAESVTVDEKREFFATAMQFINQQQKSYQNEAVALRDGLQKLNQSRKPLKKYQENT